jgi:hypothetical protein
MSQIQYVKMNMDSDINEINNLLGKKQINDNSNNNNRYNNNSM